MNIVFATSEAFPYTDSSAAADVCGFLPPALDQLGQDVSLVLPFYRNIRRKEFKPEPVVPALAVRIGRREEQARVHRLSDPSGIPVFFIEHDTYFNLDSLRDSPGEGFPGNLERFSFFSLSVLELIRHLALQPDVIHCHDWQTALVPVFHNRIASFRERYPRTATVLAIHDASQQGEFPREQFPLLGLPETIQEDFTHRGTLNILKGGILSADRLSTGSRSYAREIQTEEGGTGLEEVIAGRQDSLDGILGGVDYREWNPTTDLFLSANYEPRRIVGKRTCKENLLRTFFLPLKSHKSTPVLGMIASHTPGKGIDLIAEAAPELVQRKLILIVLGEAGEREKRELKRLSRKYPHFLRFRPDVDNALVHKLIAGSDFLLFPGPIEPRGTLAMLTLKYGTIPVARATGGLRDVIEEYHPETDRGNGFTFDSFSVSGLTTALDRALSAFAQQKNRRALIANAMSTDFSWPGPARRYLELYQTAWEKRRMR